MRLLYKSILIAMVLIALGVGGYLFAFYHAINSLTGPTHYFQLSQDNSFLTDADASSLAREVMNRDGFPESNWKMMQDDRSKAPDGRPDVYLLRNTLTPNKGVVTFLSNGDPRRMRFVHVELNDRRQITAQGTLGK